MRVRAESARDDAAIRVDARLLFGDLSAFHQVGDQGMIARQALEHAIVQQIGARIPDLCDKQPFSVDDRAGEGRAHAFAPTALPRGDDDIAVRLDDDPRELLRVGIVRGVFDKGLGGDFACDFACRMAAHAIRNGEQGRAHDQAVFVMFAHQAHVGPRTVRGERRALVPAPCASRGHYSNLARMTTSPMLMTSLLRSAVGAEMRCPLTAVPLVEPRSSTKRFWPMSTKRACRAET